MRRLCDRLEALGIKLGSRHACEFFAREGNWQTVSYASRVARLDAWEIDPSFEDGLRRNLPNADIRIGDSFELAHSPEFRRKFDFIVYDNPQLAFGAENQYCEHFEALETVTLLMNSEAVVIWNVNREPFDYHRFPDWQARRNRFYGRTSTEKLCNEFIFKFYRDYFEKRGVRVRHQLIEPRHEPYLIYQAAVLEANSVQ